MEQIIGHTLLLNCFRDKGTPLLPPCRMTDNPARDPPTLQTCPRMLLSRISAHARRIRTAMLPRPCPRSCAFRAVNGGGYGPAENVVGVTAAVDPVVRILMAQRTRGPARWSKRDGRRKNGEPRPFPWRKADAKGLRRRP